MPPEEDDSGSIREDDLSEEWRQEIARPLRQIDSGEVDLIPWEEVERSLWSKIRS